MPIYTSTITVTQGNCRLYVAMYVLFIVGLELQLGAAGFQLSNQSVLETVS